MDFIKIRGARTHNLKNISRRRLQHAARPDRRNRRLAANQLYTESKTAIADGSFGKGIKYFEELESRYSYAAMRSRRSLRWPTANHCKGAPASAIAACNRFIRLHPTHPNVATPTTFRAWSISTRISASSVTSATRT